MEMLKQSLLEVVTRQAILRTVFRQSRGQLVQVVLPVGPFELPILDMREVKAEDRDAHLFKIATKIAAEGFDLAEGPLVRFHLAVFNENEHVLLVAQHHIIADAWSVMLLGTELAAIYRAYEQERPLPVRPAIQFADYAKWEQKNLAEMEFDRQFWAEHLSGLPPLNLPVDRREPLRISNHGSRVPVHLATEISQRILALANEEGCTPFVALLAGYSAFLHRHSGQLDFGVGTGIAQRSQNGLREIAGFLVNTVVLRCDVSGSPSFRELLRRMRALVAQAMRHSKLPFGEVVKVAATDRRSDQDALLQTNFVLESISAPEMELPEMLWQPLSWAPDGAVEGTAKFDLSLLLLEGQVGFNGVFEYSSDRFDHASVERLASRFETFFCSIVAAPDQSIGTLSLLSEAELGTVSAGWCSNEKRKPELRVIELLASHARTKPQSMAMIRDGEATQYGELYQRVRQISVLLNAAGLASGERVGICLTHPLDVVIAALGVLKSGGVFVPLEVSEPLARMEFILRNSGASWIITEPAFENRFQDKNLRLLHLDQHDGNTLLEPGDDFHIPWDGDRLACVLYRPSKKGKPQGVLIKHWVLCSAVFPEAKSIIDTDRIAFHINFLSEATALVPFQTLAAGACIVDLGSVFLPPRKFAALLRDHAVTVLFSSAAMADRVAREFPRALKGVRLVVCEDAWPTLLRMKETLKADVLDKLCGVWAWSEASGIWLLLPVTQMSESGFSLQREFLTPGIRVRLLDEKLSPVPDGVIGEIMVGADSLALGYLNDPEGTADAFVQDPFAGPPGPRLYRTGDFARMHEDTLEPCGRQDRKAVIGGLRIDEEEIESAILANQGVKEVTVARAESNGLRESGFTAVVVNANSGFVSDGELQNFLRQRLPEALVPHTFLRVDKISRLTLRALLNPAARENSGTSAPYQAPQNSVEQQLADIWMQTLRLGQVGVRDNFFRLGGHSLLATQVVARISDVFQVDISLRKLFEAPTIAEMAKMIEAAEAARKAAGEGGSDYHAIERVARDGDLPLSFAQQRLWFLDQMTPGDISYNVPGAVWIEGPIDKPALQASLKEIVRRHEVLRTRFLAVHGEPQQVIDQEFHVQIPVDDLEHLPPEAREAEAQERARKEAQAAFDLTKGPMLRVRLLRLSDLRHVLLVTIHHIASDGWSLGVLMRELTVLYEAFCKDLPSPLPELAVQYVDYSCWQRRWLTRTMLEQQLGYWEKQLSDIQTLDLPADRQRPSTISNRGAAAEVRVPAGLTLALKNLAQQHGATLFMVLLAGFKVLLYRYTRQTDLAVGSPIAGRRRTEIESLIGFFVNTLVLRTDLSGAPHFIELLGRVRETTLQAYAHQDLPFEKLVEELAPERDLARMPLFQVMFVLQNAPQSDLRIGAAKLRLFNINNATSKLDLLFSLQESDGELCGSLEYCTDIFEQQSIVQMIEHYLMLLEGIARNPLQSITTLQLLTGSERRLLLSEWTRTEAEYLKTTCVHELFEQQVQRTPDAAAVEHQGVVLSYAELNARANQLGHYLRNLHVRPESPVGICMERGLDMIVGMIGVLKSGGAYVPMDPNYPAERLIYTLENSGAPVLLTQRSLLAQVPAYKGRVVVLDEQWPEIAGEDNRNLDLVSFPENLAYVIYTSGSTGKPKGVAIRHSSAVAFLGWAKEVFPPEDLARVLASTSICFDLSVFEIFATLSSGGTAVLVENALALPELSPTTHLTLINTVPSAMRELLRMRAVPSTVRTINLAGEALSEMLVRDLIDNVGNIERIFNLYGPSEDTTYSTFDWWQKGKSSAVIPIGKPISNTRTYVLNDEMDLLPVGIPGELYIAGEGLARGYLNRSDLTAERFVPDPFSAKGGERLYRTGDLVRYLAGGTLQYLGRIDHQVKIRGYRIELGEIESGLQSHAQVERAVVLAREDSPGDLRLVGYVAPRLSDRPRPEAAEWQQEQLSQWEMVWDRIYGESRHAGETALNITGWNSSYTGEPLPEEDMREWAQSTVARIQSLNAQRILEIGCGTGLLLLSIAQQCRQYVGTDISEAALAYIANRIKGKPEYAGVSLQRLNALDAGRMKQEEPFDLIILNSVIQYFPGADYLMRVLGIAAGLLREGGCIFVGDVRNRGLLEAFHTSVELVRAKPAATVDAIRRQVSNKIQREEELVVDPAFFYALSGRMWGITHAEAWLRRGFHENEMTKFRYDVLLQIGGEPADGQNAQWIDWLKEGLSLQSLREALIREKRTSLALKRIPNSRVNKDVEGMRSPLAAQPGSLKISEFKELLAQEIQVEINREQIYQLAAELGFDARVTWSGSGTDGNLMCYCSANWLLIVANMPPLRCREKCQLPSPGTGT